MFRPNQFPVELSQKGLGSISESAVPMIEAVEKHVQGDKAEVLRQLAKKAKNIGELPK